MTKFRRLAVLAASLGAWAIQGQQASPVTGEAVETFKPPVRVVAQAPAYPFTRRTSGDEGWVALNYMIDTSGTPYDITVHSSSGDSAFERAAIKAVEQWRYEPAQLKGQPIDAGSRINITFELSGTESGARSSFVKAWKWYHKGLEQNDAERAARNLKIMEETNRNLYEEAFYQLLMSTRYRASGDIQAEYAAVTRAAFLDNNRSFLPDDALTSVLLRKLSLELKINKLVRARATIEALRKRGAQLAGGALEELDAVANSIDAAAASEGIIKSNGQIRSDNRYVHELLKPTFAVEDVNGDLAEARLHCDKGYVGFVYSENMQYTVKQDWNTCTLILIGDPGTTFVLIERQRTDPA